MGETRHAAVMLGELARRLDAQLIGCGDESITATGIAMDHRLLSVGDIFAVVPGAHVDSRIFVGQAESNGALALLVATPVLETALPQIVVESSRIRDRVALASQLVYGEPSKHLKVIGVTGTNGKTTTVSLISEMLGLLGCGVGTMGTLWGRLTTPEAPEVARRLAHFVAEGRSYAAMEISSIALSMDRVRYLNVEVAMFTNLSQDHLDFHSSMEEYFEAKASLFHPRYAKLGVVNADDTWGQRLLEVAEVPVVGVSDAELSQVTLGPYGLSFDLRGHRFAAPLIGHHNLVNLHMALIALETLGFDLHDLVEVAREVQAPRGRLERVPSRHGSIFIDYAHSPGALEQVLTAARLSLGRTGKLMVVFGAGGERDHGKRPLMGATAERLADVVIITSDNPRSEDPQAIADDIAAGCTNVAKPRIILDRRLAIRTAVDELCDEDVLVVAGKGHERSQRIGSASYDFDDYDEALRAVLELGDGEG
ncbi:UDP-N-acetylmuramoyl-L-alanyl-D-glutamate--2,6-diaminopimelate ligase [Ferrimicrobium sp.]|uniref:UDP-N-acetylmuramoyl-L-alanyl-D-glutamate--2, 6-diaminopimelate ligase n=1 Tax=Ferrimicrobium sp. TaxID=2926050 RepID=UPI00263191D7|nr:UDP-N-acetylmuramoyl-L-alanyl-D-glutamate--2,6-diaminopimelate ligase [Ferrimicrobium sp.]